MTRLTDLIRGQSSQEAMSPTEGNSDSSREPTDLPFPSSYVPSASTPEIDWYQRASHELHGIKHAVQEKQSWAVDELVLVASGIVASLGVNDTLIQTVLQRGAGDYLVNNAVNVAIVSVKIAEALRYESAQREQVALAGLLHDLGMFTLPDALVYKAGTLTDGELRNMREHPQHGVRVLKDIEAAYPWVGRVILQEHERWDGTGYPNRLVGDQIDEMALVIGLADVFEAMMNSRPYRRGLSAHQAIRSLLVSGKTMFPHHLLKALIDQLSIYPLGTTVRLNTGETGVVFQLNRQYPLRPILQVLQAGHRAMSKKVDLRAETSLHIVEVVPVS